MKLHIASAPIQITSNWKNTLRILLKLTKPGVTLLLVFTAVTTAVAASGPWISPVHIILLAISGGLAAGGAASINHYLERDLDALMPRTANRPLPMKELPDDRWALIWGLFLAASGVFISAISMPVETTLFTLLGIIIYVPFYTLFLKQRTALNVIIGGAAGACPVLAGWSVARLDWPALPIALALVVFFWTPAHFWAFAICHEEDYKRAGFPMLPNLIGKERTAPYIVMHAFFAVLASILVLKGLPLFLAAASGLAFLAYCIHLWNNTTKWYSYKVYKASNYYLVLVFFGLLFI